MDALIKLMLFPLAYVARFAVAVGQDENSLASMRCSDGGCLKSCLLRREPERGKITEDGSESASKKSGDVFKKRPSGLNCPKNLSDMWPEPTLIIESLLSPSD